MATAEEKEARQASRDAAKSSVVQGQQRLGAEVGKAAAAFPVRRLRTSGDLSRYAIGGFLDDALPPIAMAAPPPTAAAGPSKAKAKRKAVAAKRPALKPVVAAPFRRPAGMGPIDGVPTRRAATPGPAAATPKVGTKRAALAGTGRTLMRR